MLCISAERVLTGVLQLIDLVSANQKTEQTHTYINIYIYIYIFRRLSRFSHRHRLPGAVEAVRDEGAVHRGRAHAGGGGHPRHGAQLRARRQ